MARRMAVKKPQKKASGLPRFNFSLPSNTVRVMAISGLLMLVFAGLYWLTKIPSFTASIWPIEKVSFAGSSQRINKAELIAELELSKNKGMLSIDLEIVREKVLANPWVESVEVRKQWPDTLIFILEEKLPLAILNDGYLLANGAVVDTAIMPQDREDLLTLKIANLKDMQPRKIVAATELLGSINQRLASNSFSIREIEIDRSNSWTIHTVKGLMIKTGRKNQLQRLDRFLQVYVAIENKNQLNSVDLRYRNGLAVELNLNTTSEES